MDLQKEIPLLWDIKKWQNSSIIEIENFANIIIDYHKPNFDFINFFCNDDFEHNKIHILQFKEKSSQILFNLIPGGGINIGIDSHQKKLLSSYIEGTEYFIDYTEFEPTGYSYLSPFFIATNPIMEDWLVDVIELRGNLFRPEFSDNAIFNPFYLNLDEINSILNKFSNWKMPSEIYWEYACRGGIDGLLFHYGNQLEFTLLEKYFSNFENPYPNNFGLNYLGVGEWCADKWSNNYEIRGFCEKPYLENDSEYHVIKGGASLLFPYETLADALIGCNAFRRSSELLEDQTSAFRPIILLD